MFKNYFKVALRSLQRNKIYSFINIAGLSLGLACAMLIILYVKDEKSFDKFQKNLPNIYRVAQGIVGANGSIEDRTAITGYLPGPRFSQNVAGIKTFVRLTGDQVDIKKGADILPQAVLRVDSNFFSVFTFPLLSGNPATCLKDPHSIVLSEESAKKQFGTVEAVGKTVLIKDQDKFIPYAVTAVAEKSPENSSIRFDALLPMEISPQEMNDEMNWMNSFLNTFVVLDPKANVKNVEAGMQKFFMADARNAISVAKEKYGFDKQTAYFLQPFADMHLSDTMPPQNGLSGGSKTIYSYILSGIALFVLLIACINFVNLTVARSVKRAREIGIRKVVGGNRRQLIFQFLGESMVLCFIAFGMAILIVQLVLPLFNELANKKLALSYLLDGNLIAGYISLFLLTSLLAGFYPALVLSGYNPVQTLYSRFNLTGKNYLQKSLVVLQFALASFLIIGTMIIYRQFNFLTETKLGYDDTNLVTVSKANLTYEQAKLFREQLLKSPGIEEATSKNGGNWGTAAKVNGDSIVQFAYETIDENYLPLLKIPIIEGRNFSTQFPSDSSQSVIVNEAFVKKAGWSNPIGQTVDFWFRDKKFKVIGVVKDYHFKPLNEKIGEQLFTMDNNNKYGVELVKLKPNALSAALKHIQATFKSLFPLNPYSYSFKTDDNVKVYESESKWKQIMLFSGVLTIFLSCIGLFGLSVLSAEKRTKEIGIRKVLGATVSNVVSTLSKDFLKLVFIAMIIAIPAAWMAANKWLDNYPYRITISWWIFIGAGILVIFIALATVSFQAIKAALANPVKSLRTE